MLLLLGSVSLFASCLDDKADDARARLTVSKVNVTLIKTGTLSTGSKATLDVVANKGYAITSDAGWLSVDKPEGKGRISVVLKADPNETDDIRVGYLTVTSDKLQEIIKVTQTLDPDTDDLLELGHVYLDDDFAWCEQYGGQDQVQFPDQGSTTPVRNQAGAVAKFAEMGYSEYNYKGNAFYMAKHYFKMGRSAQQNGLAIDMSKYIAKGKSSTIALTFDAAPVVSISGSGSAITLTGVDKTTITVEVYEGPGTVNGPSSKKSSELQMGIETWNQWANMKVTLYGVTDRSQIVIRSSQFGITGYYRWYLDNVKMVKAPRE
jgi:hypothetical protein